jgi:hypothetical protein
MESQRLGEGGEGALTAVGDREAYRGRACLLGPRGDSVRDLAGGIGALETVGTDQDRHAATPPIATDRRVPSGRGGSVPGFAKAAGNRIEPPPGRRCNPRRVDVVHTLMATDSNTAMALR